MPSSSLYTGVTGLEAHQNMLDVVGNNLANLNTIGFKAQQANFADLLYQTLIPGTPGNAASVGSTDPSQIGFGVKTAFISQKMTQGTFQTTGGTFDVALQGNGFFVVNNGAENLYTRAGAFSVDQNNFLVDPTTGDRVQRIGPAGEAGGTGPAFQTAGDLGIKVPLGSGIPGKASTTVTLQGNLSAGALGPQPQTLTTAQPFTSGGNPATAATTLNALSDNITPYVAGDSIVIQGATVTGAAVNTTLAVTPTTTLGDLVTAINGAFAGSTASIDASGNLVLKANANGPAPALNLVLSDAAGNTGASKWSSHTFTATTTGTNGDTLNTAIQVFDTQGTAHTLTLKFQKTANNTWSLTGTIPPSDGTVTSGPITGITFNDDGSFRQVAGSAQITFQFNGVASPQSVNLNLGTAGGFNGLTGFGGPSTANAQGQDGYAPGSLASISIDKTGLLNGVFSNGQILPIAQLAIASFTDPQGLSREGSNYYSQSATSGVPLLGTGLTGGRGSVTQGALESSNVDVALEFTNMIIAQRGYESNAKTITVSNAILQALVDIIR